MPLSHQRCWLDFTYQPTANANGADTFAITVADTAGHTVSVTVARPDGAVIDVNLDGRVDVVGFNNSVSIQGPP